MFAETEIDDYQPTQGEIARDQFSDATRTREGAFVIVFTIDARYEGLVLEGVRKFQKIAKRHKQTLEIVHEKRWTARIDRVRYQGDQRPMTNFIRYGIEIPQFVGVKGQIVAHFERAEDGTSFYTHVFKDERRAEVESYLPKLGICEHCNTKRVRNKVFVCDTDDGVKIVGSDCLKDYLGIDPAWAIQALEFAKFAEASDDEWEERWGSYGAKTHDTDYLASECFRVAKMFGGYSRQVSDDMKHHLSLLLFGNRSTDERARRANDDILAKYNVKLGNGTVKKVFDPEFDRFALSDFIDRMDGDFGSNVRIAASSEYVAYARANLMLAGIGLFVGRLVRIEKPKDEVPAKLLDAPVGKRVDIVGKVIRTSPYMNDFGGGTVVVIRCADGSNLVHFSSSVKPNVDEMYAIRATVKAHGSDKRSGAPQTIVSRAVYKRVQGAPPAATP